MAQRTRVSMDDDWVFEDTVEVNLPHTWNTDAYRRVNYDRSEKTYRRLLNVPDEPAGRRYYLRIDAASKSSKVLVNGRLAGTHHGGYTAHQADITPYLHPGSDNLIEIKVDNADEHVPPISADFTFMGGLYRHVWLITTPAQHFSLTDHGAGGLRATPYDVSDDAAKVRLDCSLTSSEVAAGRYRVEARLVAPDGQTVAVQRTNVRFRGAGAQTCTLNFRIARPRLWSPDAPNLYRVEAELVAPDGRVTDREECNVGLRRVQFDAGRGLLLNGKPLKLRGICIHQDQYPYGVAMTDEMHRRDLRRAKEMGVNFVRLAHYPQADVMLEECDRLGMMVWEEIPVVNYVPEDEVFAEVAKTNLREMIRQHYNHPSVILWGYMNEILLRTRGVYKGEAAERAIRRTLALAKELEQIVREEDSGRTSTMALHGSDEYNKVGLTDIPQVLGWNLYQGWYGNDLSDFDAFVDRQHREHPTHPIIISEWGAGSDLRIHSTRPRAFDFSMEYQQKYIEHYLPVIENRPFILGSSYWNFVDFSSAGRQESMPFINNKGLLTADRRVKDVYYYFQAMWRKDIPVTHIATRDRTDWVTSDEGQTIKVYTNAPSVRLRVNGRDAGMQQVTNCTALFEVSLREGRNVIEALTGSDTPADVVTVQFRRAGGLPLQPGEELAVNVGSNASYRAPGSEVTWLEDRAYEQGAWGYVRGTTYSTKGTITNTDDTPLYQTMRTRDAAYRFDVPAGVYEVLVLHAVDPQRTARTASDANAYLLGASNGRNFRAMKNRRRVVVGEDGLTVDAATFGYAGTLSGILVRRIR